MARAILDTCWMSEAAARGDHVLAEDQFLGHRPPIAMAILEVFLRLAHRQLIPFRQRQHQAPERARAGND